MNQQLVSSNHCTEIRRRLNKRTVGIVLALILILYIVTVIPTKIAYAGQDEPERTYDIVEIEQGDTLWSIAVDNCDRDYETVEQYISLLKKCNNLTSDRITAGCYLIVPGYEQ